MYTPSKKYGIVKSKKYRDWIEKNVPLIKNGLKKPINFPIEVQIVVVEGRDFNNKSDIDNVLKAICDALTKAEIIPDDNVKFIRKCEARFMESLGKRSEAVTLITIIEDV